MTPQTPDVTIVGAGIAGMTSALRLLEAGFSVKVIEASSGLGGKFGAVYAKQRYHDFAWHVYADWCLNFWELVDTIGLDRGRDFVAKPKLTILRPREGISRWPRTASVSHVGVPEFFWQNANSGIAHWADVMLFTHSLYALLCDESLEREEFLNRVTVNGYMRSLPHMSDVAALLHNELLLRIWAIPSYLISARAYQTHLQLVAPFDDRGSSIVVLRKNFNEAFWEPFRRKLESFGPRFTLALDTRLKAIRMRTETRRIESVVVQGRGDGPLRAETVRQLIVAIPPAALVTVLADPESLVLRQDQPGLLDLSKLPSQQTSSLSLHLKRPLQIPGVDDEILALIDDFEDLYAPGTLAPRNGLGSQYGLSLIDVGRLSGEERATTYSVLASDADSLGPLDDDEACQRVMRVLQAYLPFEHGDVDWTSTHFQGHRTEKLFVNAVGSWEYRPEVRLRNSAGDVLRDQLWQSVHNLYLAGDYCRSRIDIVSLEGAIHTALWAAHALSTRVRAETGSRAPTVREPTPPRSWGPALPEARKVLSRLDRWAELAGRRSQGVAREIKAAARQAAPPITKPLAWDSPPTTNSPPTTTSRSHPEGNGGSIMTDALSTHSGLLTPPISAMAADWTDAARGGDIVSVPLKSGATVSVPLLFWDTQALVLHGTADGDAIDGVLRDQGLRAIRVNSKNPRHPAPGSSVAAVQIWASDYGGTTVGPVKAVFAVIPVQPRRDCKGEHRKRDHLWWWWYYGNSILNQEFKRDVWGVPNEHAVVETAYRHDAKSVRLLERGRLALRLHMAWPGQSLVVFPDPYTVKARRRPASQYANSQSAAKAGPGPGIHKTQSAADKELAELNELLKAFAQEKQTQEADEELQTSREARKARKELSQSEPAHRFVSVARRAHDDGENEVSVIGSMLAGPSFNVPIPFKDKEAGGSDEFYRGAGTEIDKRLEDVDFEPVSWDFYTTYNGIVWMYDGKGRGKPDRRDEIERDLGRRLIEKLDLSVKDYGPTK